MTPNNFHNPLILWDPARGKWQDPGNDFLCYELSSGKWRVSARYGFDPEIVTAGGDDREFPDQTQAMEFYVNYLHQRREQLTVSGYEKRIGTMIRNAARTQSGEGVTC